MKKRALTLAALVALCALTSAQAREFDGLFIGGKVGNNNTDISGGPLQTGSKNTTTWGIDEGYNWDMDSYLLGADFFVNVNHKADHVAQTEGYSSSAMGLGLKLGVPMDNWLPYVHLGYAKTKAVFTVLPFGAASGTNISEFNLVGGLGVEYKFAPNWSVNAEWSGSSATSNASKLNNDNVTLGVRYYMAAPAAPAPVPVPPPVVAKEVAPIAKAEPVVAPAPAPVVVPVPAPVVKAAPAPQPKKAVLTEKLVRLEGANFATNSAKLLKTADVKLEEVVKAAKEYPDVKLEVSGHTDSRGKLASNQKLSEHRAIAVKAWLVKHGVAAERISTIGYADAKPIADNKTQAGRAANRRVEVRYSVKE